MGAYTLEDEEVTGKGLSSSLRPPNYHMAVRIAVFCVNIPVFSRGDSDLESTVHRLESCFLALRQHTQGQGWRAGPEGGPAPRARPEGGPGSFICLEGARLPHPRPEPWHLPGQASDLCWPVPHTTTEPQETVAVLFSSCKCLPCQYVRLVLGPFEPGWKLGSWNRTSCSCLYRLK